MNGKHTLISAPRTHPGRKRPHNEDFVTFYEPDDPEDLRHSGCLYIVADGVGGSSFGEHASKYAAERVSFEYYDHPEMEPGDRLKFALRKAGNEIYTFAEESERFVRMATTMVAATIIEDRVVVANVGDSRAYLLRNGSVNQITHDHSFVGEMVRSGEMTEDEAMHSKSKNRITRSLGGEKDVTVDIFDFILQAGDRLLLCTDGLTRYANLADISRLTKNGGPEEITQRLIDFANQEGGADNISVIVIDFDSPLASRVSAHEARGDVPRDVDWETVRLETQASLHRGRKTRSMGSSTRLILILLFAFVVLTVVGVVAFIQPDLSPLNLALPTQTQSQTVSSTETEVTSNDVGAIETGENEQSPQITQTPASVVNTPVLQMAGRTEDVLPSPSPVPTITGQPLERYACAAQVAPGSNITQTFAKFGVGYQDGAEYFYLPGCDDINTNPETAWLCPGKEIQITDFKMISPEWFVIIPDIVKEKCNPDFGIWVQIIK